MASIKLSPLILPEATVATGTAVPLASVETKVENFTLQAPKTNTGNIFVGDLNVSATVKMFVLEPGQSITVEADTYEGDTDYTYTNLQDWYIDGTGSGDVVLLGTLQEETVTY